MTDTELELTKLRWRVGLLQRMLVGSLAVFSAKMGEPPQEFHQLLLVALETTQRENYELLLSPVLQQYDGALLAEEFAQVVEEMKASINSMLATP